MLCNELRLSTALQVNTKNRPHGIRPITFVGVNKTKIQSSFCYLSLTKWNTGHDAKESIDLPPWRKDHVAQRWSRFSKIRDKAIVFLASCSVFSGSLQLWKAESKATSICSSAIVPRASHFHQRFDSRKIWWSKLLPNNETADFHHRWQLLEKPYTTKILTVFLELLSQLQCFSKMRLWVYLSSMFAYNTSSFWVESFLMFKHQGL